MPKSKPFTTRAAVLILYELQRIKDAGHCPNAALDQSTLHGWADVWPAKDKAISRKGASEADATRAYLDGLTLTPEQRASSDKARKAALSSIKRVAR
jgi:hypothetical protein